MAETTPENSIQARKLSRASWVPEALRRIDGPNDVLDVLPLPYVLLSPPWLVA